MSFTNNNNRYSTYSNISANPQHAARASQQLPSQVSTQTLLGVLHGAHQQNSPFQLESSTSLVVNTWQASIPGPDGRSQCVVDAGIANKAWEHARRRAEDGCIVLASLHESAPSTLVPFISALPFSVPTTLFTALATIRPFLECVTPQNHAKGRHSALAVAFTLGLQTGHVAGAELKLSAGGIDTRNGLADIPKSEGHRAFDIFYYLLSSASTATEREALGLKSPSSYTLLRRSGSYEPPSYLPTADDAAAAEDFRANLKAIGITGNDRRGLLSVLAAILKIGDTSDYLVDDDFVEAACEEAADLLDLEPQVLLDIATGSNTDDRSVLIGAIYEALVDWILVKANQAISREIIQGKHASDDSESRLGAITPQTSDNGDTASITVLEIPSPTLGKAVALKNVFDDFEGINAEMKEDGVVFPSAGHTVIAEMQNAISQVEPELGILNGPAGRDWELRMDRRTNLLEKIGIEITDDDCLLKKLLYPLPLAGESISLGSYNRCNIADVIGSSRVWFQLSIYPTDKEPAKDQKFEASSPSRQLRDWRLPEWANRRNKQLDYTADFDHEEFCSRYSRLGCLEGKDGIESFILERGWSNGEIAVGETRVWVREGVWMELENMLDMLPQQQEQNQVYGQMSGDMHSQGPPMGSGYFNSPFADNMTISQDNLAPQNQNAASMSRPRSLAPTQAMTMRSVSGGDYGLGRKGDAKDGTISYYNELDPELAEGKKVEEVQVSTGRRVWVAVVWALTFWIPSPLLRYVGRMKRPDVRMAWREKFVLVFLIFLANAILVFYIIAFGRILCPNYDKAWNLQELSTHQGTNDMYVSVYGRVYDISRFSKIDHSSGEGGLPPVQQSQMEQTAGQDVTPMFPLALETYCAPLVVTGQRISLEYNNTDAAALGTIFSHASGPITRYATTTLNDTTWYQDHFLTRMKDYYKGDLVYSKKNVTQDGEQNSHYWFIINDQVYDLTNYFYTKKRFQNAPNYSYLDNTLEQMVQNNPGADLTDNYNNWLARNATAARQNFNCLNNIFYLGKTDYRDTAKCQVNSYILLVFTCLLCAVILVKFLAALQFGSKRKPAPQDKFVICHVPAYTEGEDDLRKGLDSLTALKYDNKRKLICVVCDGVIVGGGNDRPTPKIVLDILGVDPKIDPPALPFKSVGQGAEQLNYGKVYSGLYEFEGNVVPYIVVVKVGKESEQTKTKPGNRGKRDSQILLMSFLNRVHHRSAMSPLELEMFHQINNVIGVDPELYEYVFMVDADTMVHDAALTKLVAACADDSKIAGICGETSLRNEERSWTTMIQVYEYYISHHLAKAFESLFGSVTCLPGCFCMYRLRTADKGKPLLISDKVVNEYSDCNVDTLHKKNLLSLGEDRYLTTLMTKHFPFMRYKFVPDAFAQTAAPESWSILLSQRRRWINSTIHNLAELVWIKDMCGFCCFSMRFVVFIDLFGTIMLPATCAYLVYLIVIAATGKAQFPILSIIIIAAVYGLQAIIFIMKRQWQHIGWMIIYIIAFPIYSLILPVYSFWKQDDFSWGNTRVVIGEKGNKQIVAVDDEGFDPRNIPLQPWDDYALQNNLPGRRGNAASEKPPGYEDGYEMDDMRSVYSAARPASTVLTGFRSQNPGNFYMSPQSPGPNMSGRQSGMRQSQSTFHFPYQDQPSPGHDPTSRLMSMGNAHEQHQSASPYGYGRQSPGFRSSDNLMRQSGAGTPLNRAGRQSPMPFAHSRPASTINFQQNMGHGEASDAVITEAIQDCLATVDLDNVTKKSLKALVEQRLHMQLSNERRSFLDRQIDHELANM